MRTSRGFTLIELLVVMSIIAVLATIVLVGGELARESGRNAERTASVLEYKSAIDLSYDAGNAYIQSESGQPACLGTYDDNKCWHNYSGGPFSISSRLNDAFRSFIQGAQRPPATNLPEDGILYQQCAVDSYHLWWFLEGKNQSCKGGTVIDGNYEGTNTTYCEFVQGSTACPAL